ncbi:MAG: hypothetical protein WDO17_17270 [Alphaproteobacteria bacterium]
MNGEAHGVADDSSISVFTGAELALADTVILLMKVMSMHGIIDSEAIETVFSDLEGRYRAQNLATATAMAEYLRRHAADADQGTLIRVQTPAEKSGDI